MTGRGAALIVLLTGITMLTIALYGAKLLGDEQRAAERVCHTKHGVLVVTPTEGYACVARLP